MGTFLKDGIVTRYRASGIDLVDLPIASEGLIFRFIGSSLGNDRVALVIEFTDETNSREAFKKAWPAIEQWRDAIKQHNGPWIHGGESGFYWELNRRHRPGMSYRKLTILVNKWIANHLCEYHAFLEELAKSDFWTILTETKYNPYSLERADDILRLCRPGMSPKERKVVLEEGLESIKAGDNAFYDPEVPVAGADIRERIRQWRDKWGDSG